MAKTDVRQDFEATLLFRVHTVQLDVFDFQVQNSPRPCLAFLEYKLQPEEVPSAGLCCRAASSSLWALRFSPEAQRGPGLWQCRALQQTLLIQALQALWGWEHGPARAPPGCLQTPCIACDTNSS